jgi:hypothetical protein
MNPNDVVKLLQHILPWIPSSSEGIRGEIENIIRQLKGK